MSGRRAQVVGVLALVAITVGVLTLVAARNEPFALAGGVRLWRLVHMNMLGSVLTLGAGVLGVVAWRRRSVGITLATGASFSVLASPAWAYIAPSSSVQMTNGVRALRTGSSRSASCRQ